MTRPTSHTAIFLAFLVVLFRACPVSQVSAQESGASAGETVSGPKKGLNISWFPVIFYTPETKLAGGGGFMMTYRPEHGHPTDRPQSCPVVVYYTSRSQAVFAMEPELYFANQGWKFKTEVAYQRVPDSFWGVGNDTPDEAEEEYTVEEVSFQPRVLRRIHSHLFMGFEFDFKRTALLEVQEGGLLHQRAIVGHAGGIRSGVGPVIVWDRRDNIFCPWGGSWYQFYATYYRDWLGSDFNFDLYGMDLRYYYAPKCPHVLAFQLCACSRSGNVPFNKLAQVGQRLRGIVAGRFQDRFMAMTQAEYRFPLMGRFGGAVFLGVGDVADGYEEFSTSNLKVAGGAGIRIGLIPEEKVNLRLDIGYSEWGTQAYLEFSEAF
jgi:hypothetical protein